MSLDVYLWYYIVLVVVLTFSYSLYGVVSKPHIIKKLIFVTILSDAAYVLLVFIGFRPGAVMPPVYPGGTLLNPQLPLNPREVLSFASMAVDPIPQVLIVTAIVIGLAQLIFLAVLALKIVEATGTFSIKKLEVSEE